jgi:hypothetical protein
MKRDDHLPRWLVPQQRRRRGLVHRTVSDEQDLALGGASRLHVIPEREWGNDIGSDRERLSLPVRRGEDELRIPRERLTNERDTLQVEAVASGLESELLHATREKRSGTLRVCGAGLAPVE